MARHTDNSRTCPNQAWPRYGLFVHYMLRPTDWLRDGVGGIYLTEAGQNRLKEDIDYLQRILEPSARRGVLNSRTAQPITGFAFLFLDPGWREIVRRFGGAGQNVGRDQFLVSIGQLSGQMNALYTTYAVRIITAAELSYFLADLGARIRPDQRRRFTELLFGGNNRMLYDMPKVVEAIIRIANVGRNFPIFRFDDDVIFRGSRGPRAQRDATTKQTRSGLHALLKEYVRRSRDPAVGYFAFSGAYLDENTNRCLSGSGSCPEVAPGVLLNGLATRVLQLARVPMPRAASEPGAASVQLDCAAAIAFLRSLANVGANPFRQVISGAGLCLSDGAILDLPPFSNMREYIVWIDDHLKYALHHELGHFTHSLKRSARAHTAVFTQHRYDGELKLDDVEWAIKTYMLRLVRGCVADAWLRGDPRLKETLRDLSESELRDVLRTVPSTYARMMIDRELTGDFDRASDPELRATLWKLGVARLRDLVETWSESVFRGTFLELFIEGSRERQDLQKFLPAEVPKGLRQAVGNLPEEPPDLAAHGSRAGIELLLEQLIEDFTHYIELTEAWGSIVRAVRVRLSWQSLDDRARWVLPDGRCCCASTGTPA